MWERKWERERERGEMMWLEKIGEKRRQGVDRPKNNKERVYVLVTLG